MTRIALPLLLACQAAVPARAAEPPSVAVDVLLRTAREEALAARWDDADALVASGLRLAGASGDRPREVRLQVQRAHVLLDRASYQGAPFEAVLPLVDTALAAARRLGDAELLSDVLHVLGRAHYVRQFRVPTRDYGPANAAFAEARTLRDAGRDRSRRAETLFYQGLVHEQSGRDVEAKAAYEAAMSLATSARDPLMQSSLYRHLAGYQEATRGLEGVLDYFRRSLQLREEVGGVGVVFGHIAVGETLARIGRAAEAVPHFQEAVKAGERAGIRRGVASAHLGLAAAAAGRGDARAHHEHARMALVAAAHARDPRVLDEATKALAAASPAP